MKLNYSIEEQKGLTRVLTVTQIRDELKQKKAHSILCETQNGFVKKVGLFNGEEITNIIPRKKYARAIMPELTFI